MHKKCERKLLRNRYEQNAPEIRKWWQQLFEILEHDVLIKPEKRMCMLKEAIPPGILAHVLSELSVHCEMLKYASTSEESNFSPESKSISNRPTAGTHSLPMHLEATRRKNLSLVPNPSTNPYLEFFRRRPDEAAIWSELPPVALEEMSLNQLAQAISAGIAKDFIRWLGSIPSDEAHSINLQNIIDMFGVGSKLDFSTTVCVDLKEVPTVPGRVARTTIDMKMLKRTTLQREIRRDYEAALRKPKLEAFGRRLPTKSQIKPPPKNEKWLVCATAPPELDSMATVWDGIQDLKSTKAFCEFLNQEHPEIVPPKFLIEAGLMNPDRVSSQGTLNQTYSYWEVQGLMSSFT
ncbi:hypothetical protein JTB14_008351 [Gonioctena quinquepunctata]|nr:hypothetical protein JTB14_008351 [Gonioctena quinquepunctata]